MKVYFNQLAGKLKKQLAPVYLVAGEEALQKMEAADMIRHTATEQGFAERNLFFVETGFDWGSIKTSSGNLSLFSQKKLIEIIFQGEKIDKAAADFLKSFVATLSPEVLVLIRANKVDARQAWVKRISDKGVFIQVYEKNASDMYAWIRERLLKVGLKAEHQVVEMISERVSGNMLSAAQEITKLELLCAEGLVKQSDVEQSVGVSAKFSVFDLADSVCAGDTPQAIKIMRVLKMENSPLPLILWSITTQLRKLAGFEQRLAQGERVDAILKSEWSSKQKVVRQALQRKLGRRWYSFLYWCGEVDKSAKGVGKDEAWNELMKLVLRLCAAGSLAQVRT